ncbi:thioredoxin family protein [Agromyces sp. NPDC004153]
MNPRTTGVLTVLIGALVLTGCAGPTTDAAGTSTGTADVRTPTPTRTADATTAPATDEAIPEAPAAPAPGAYVDYTDGAIEATAGQKVLFFHASWCPQCRTLDEELRAQGAPDGLTVFKVDYDSRTDLRQKYGVTLQTTVVFVDDRGELVSSSVLYDDPSVASLVAAIP